MTAMAAYEAGLLGRAPCWVHPRSGPPRLLPLQRWTAAAGPQDEALLDAAARPGHRTLDVGCGPGRITAALGDRGALASGIDVSRVAVALTRRRGVPAVRADVFDPLPGGWDAVVLADGNIGIGADPLALLRRIRDLLRVGGLLVADVQGGGGVRRSRNWLCAHHRTGGPLVWATVGQDAIEALGRAAGLAPGRSVPIQGGAVATWRREW